MQCKNCLINYHTKCINVDKTEVLCELWYCPYCVQVIFPYNHFDDDDDCMKSTTKSSPHLESMTVLTPPLLI